MKQAVLNGLCINRESYKYAEMHLMYGKTHGNAWIANVDWAISEDRFRTFHHLYKNKLTVTGDRVF